MKDVSNVVRMGQQVSKQIKVSVRANRRLKYFGSNGGFEKFLNEVIRANKPVKRRGKRILWQTTLQYKVGERVMNVSDEFKKERFSLATLNSLHVRGTNYDDETFDWGYRNAVNLENKIYVSYKYVDKNGLGIEDNETDCLLDCIQGVVLLDDEQMKKFREIIPEGCSVPVDSLSLIEEELSINMNVVGYYESKMLWGRTVNMTLFNNHYELASVVGRSITVCSKDGKQRPIVLRCGFNMGRMTKEGFIMKGCSEVELATLKRLHMVKKILLVEVEEEPDEVLWRGYNDFDRYVYKKYGMTITNYNSLAEFAVGLWSSFLKRDLYSARAMDDVLLDCLAHSGSALVDIKDCSGECVMYDYNSYYPSLLLNDVQVKCPEWGEPSESYKKKLDEEEKKKYGCEYFLQLKVGWFHVEIAEEELYKEFPRRFAKSKFGYYYYKEVKEMDRLGYKYKLTSQRAILMSGDRAVLFREFYKDMFEYKLSTGNVVCKKVMNSLLGKLASKTYKVRRLVEGKDLVLKKDEDVVASGANNFVTKSYKVSKYRYMPWIQAKVFAEARVKMNETIDKLGRSKVFAVQTDSIVVLKGGEVPTNVSSAMGDLKVCGGLLNIVDGKKIWIK